MQILDFFMILCNFKNIDEYRVIPEIFINSFCCKEYNKLFQTLTYRRWIANMLIEKHVNKTIHRIT